MSETTHSLKHLKRQSKDSLFKTQLATIFQYLKNNTATASMVSDATGIPQKSICRYKRDMEKNGLLMELLKTRCKITGCKAWYLTTNKLLFINQSKTI